MLVEWGSFPVGSDGDAQVTSSLYGFTGDPYAVFIAGNGTIVAIHRGPLSVRQLLSLEHEALTEKLPQGSSPMT